MNTFFTEWSKQKARAIVNFTFSIIYTGKGRYCPICKKNSRKFLSYGRPLKREDAICTHCGSLERHRFVWLYFQKLTNLFNNKQKKILHVAPESCFVPPLKKYFGKDYITADLYSPRADVKMDITDIKYPDNYFDVIYCSHVLEHVQDDKKAMREFHRVLKKDGWAMLLVPITAEKTYEDPSITDPEERLKAFGQRDHVRCYGLDYIDRLKEAGFTVKIAKAEDTFTKEERELMGLTKASGEIYYCTK
jgi:SAM-dependent methyltransferase